MTLETTQAAQATAQNSSGQQNAVLPEELRGLNWGAFFLGWIWAIGNKTLIGFLLCFFLGGIGNIICLFIGNDMAWKNRHFASVEEFKAVQKAWFSWGLAIFLIGIAICIISIILALALPNMIRR